MSVPVRLNVSWSAWLLISSTPPPVELLTARR